MADFVSPKRKRDGIEHVMIESYDDLDIDKDDGRS